MRLPSTLTNYRGEERRVGVEIEFAGIDVDTAVTCVTALVGGEVRHDNPFLVRVATPGHGEFRVELDARFLQDQGYLDLLGKFGVDVEGLSLRQPLEEFLAGLASALVPLEICTPPLPMRDLALVERLVSTLRGHGAKGTASAFLYAFGMQFNIEAASLEAAEVLAVLRAWLVHAHTTEARRNIDFMRRLSPFVRPFEADFVAHFLQPAYAPDMTTFIDDYLRLNPTRNRPLDLLPLLAFVDRERVLAAAAEPQLVKPRPAYHFRLPDCHVDRADWSAGVAWQEWLAVEALATDRARLAAAARDLAAARDG